MRQSSRSTTIGIVQQVSIVGIYFVDSSNTSTVQDFVISAWNVVYTEGPTGDGAKSSCLRSGVLTNKIIVRRISNDQMIPTTTQGIKRDFESLLLYHKQINV
jgi:hypothetical protein